MQSVTLVLHPLETPAVCRPCGSCGRNSRFRSSDKFRVNGNGKSLDVWLIYRCESCQRTWNLTVHTRCHVKRLPADLLAGYQQNDRRLAWRRAFERQLVEAAGAEFEGAVPLRIDGAAPELCFAGKDSAITFSCPFPVESRLDRILGQVLQVSRTTVRTLADEGAVTVAGASIRRALRRSVRHGLTVTLLFGSVQSM